MATAHTNALPTAPVGAWALPILGIFLAAIGAALAAVGMAELAEPARSLASMSAHTAAEVAVTAAVQPPPPVEDTGLRVRGPEPAIAPLTDTGTAACLCSLARPLSDPSRAPGIDLRAAALLGPPDRQPAAKWLSDVIAGERGEARGYLEETAAARWLAPEFRAVMAWTETSAYGAVEANRANDGGVRN